MNKIYRTVLLILMSPFAIFDSFQTQFLLDRRVY